MGTTRLDNGFVAHCMELLAVLGPIRPKRMFGGHGLYADDVFVAIITRDQLYLKTDDQTRPRFEGAGCEPFRYERRAKDGSVTTASLGYYQPPEEALESAALMAPWARLAMEAALRSANAKPSKPTKPSAAARPPTAARRDSQASPGRSIRATRGEDPGRDAGSSRSASSGGSGTSSKAKVKQPSDAKRPAAAATTAPAAKPAPAAKAAKAAPKRRPPR